MQALDRLRRRRDIPALLLSCVLIGVIVYVGSCRDRVALSQQPDDEVGRSTHWPAVRDAWIKAHPECAACGAKAKTGKPLQCHHLIPFSVDANGDVDGDGVPNELDPDNLITLCVDGVGGTNCHLMIGHSGNFRCHNPNCVRDAKRFREMLKGRICQPSNNPPNSGDVKKPDSKKKD